MSSGFSVHDFEPQGGREDYAAVLRSLGRREMIIEREFHDRKR